MSKQPKTAAIKKAVPVPVEDKRKNRSHVAGKPKSQAMKPLAALRTTTNPGIKNT